MTKDRKYIVVTKGLQSVTLARPLNSLGTNKFLLTEEEVIDRVGGCPHEMEIYEVIPREIQTVKKVV